MTEHHITFYAAEAGDYRVTVTDADGNAQNLTGLTAKYRVLNSDGTTLLDKSTSTSGVTITDAAGGVLEIAFEAADTTQTPGAYDHELRLEGTGYAETVMTGQLRILDSVFVA